MDRNDIYAFLMDQTRRELHYSHKEYTQCLIKVAYDAQTDILYMFSQYKDPHAVRIGSKPEYAGFVSLLTMQLYDASYSLRDLLSISWEEQVDASSLLKRMGDEVSAEICRLVDNKPVPVTATAEKIWREENDREYHIKHGAREEARKLFFNRSAPPTYTPRFSYDVAAADQIIRFVNDHDAFVADEARNYIIKNANHINFRLWKNEISLNEYDALEHTPGDHHIGRAILECLGNGVKKVIIHLLKDGVSFEGKINADALRRSDGYAYSDYSLDASDRRRFAETYGHSARILPNDIIKIIYGKRTLYERGAAY